MKKAVLCLSGGIDSITLLYQLANIDHKVTALIFNYGQTLEKEIHFANYHAQQKAVDINIMKIDLSFLRNHSAIIDGGPPIPVGRTFAKIDAQTPPTYVHFRNGIFLAYATAYAEANKISKIYLGANGLNSGQYWDDTLTFASAFQKAARAGTDPGFNPEIIFPYARWEKKEIVKLGLSLGLDYSKTWSCYFNGMEHCGTCDSCLQRLRALNGAKNENL